MALDKFLIGYTDENSGYQTNLKPWLINDNAFSTLENSYIWRGRVRKRFGSSLMGSSQLESRLRVLVGVTDSMTGNLSVTVPGTDFGIGQMFSVGNDTFTVWQLGTPGSMLTTAATATGTYNTTTGALIITGETISTDVWFYPATPVMGLTLYFLATTNDYISIGFDTQFSYKFDDINNNWVSITPGISTWTGTDTNFFWMTNYQGLTASTNYLWVTNNFAADGIRYYDGTTWFKPVLDWTKGASIGTTNGSGTVAITIPTANTFVGQVFTVGLTSFTVAASSLISPYTLIAAPLPGANITGSATLDPTTPGGGTSTLTVTTALPNTIVYWSGNNYIQTALIIINFKGRLLLLNTTEIINGVSTVFPTRMRYSAIGNPLASTAWMGDIPGQGGFIDAPTTQPIVTAQFIKDRLIVYFEASTFELVYTNNQVQPFIWQKINTELGATSTFSQIPFDKFVLGIDDVGIHACNGANVDRIDQKIPSLVWSFDTEHVGDVNRVCGIRDYYLEMAYWSFASDDRNSSFNYPNQILTYNYANDSWAINDDSFTTFGYYLLQVGAPGATWGSTTTPWGQNLALWNANSNATNSLKARKIVAGNQQGFVSILDSDVTSNASVLQIDNFVTTGLGGIWTVYCTNHNLGLDDYFALSNMAGMTFTDSLGNVLPNPIGRVVSDTVNNVTVNSFQAIFLDNALQADVITGTYNGGGTAARVSEVDIVTKQYNFYTQDDRNIFIPRIDFLVDKTTAGQIIADYFVSSTNLSITSEGLGTLLSPGPLPGNNVLETKAYDPLLLPLEQFQDRLWHPVYFYADGNCVQFELYFGINQMFGYVATTINGTTTYDYIALNDFQMHAMIISAQKTSNRMQ